MTFSVNTDIIFWYFLMVPIKPETQSSLWNNLNKWRMQWWAMIWGISHVPVVWLISNIHILVNWLFQDSVLHESPNKIFFLFPALHNQVQLVRDMYITRSCCMFHDSSYSFWKQHARSSTRKFCTFILEFVSFIFFEFYLHQTPSQICHKGRYPQNRETTTK